MEKYLLGHCTIEEEQEIDQLLSESDELQKYFSELEDIQFALTEKIKKTPPPAIKQIVKDEINAQKASKAQADNKKSGISWTTVILILLFLLSLFLVLSLAIDKVVLQRELDLKERQIRSEQDLRENLDQRLNIIEQNMYVLQHPDTRRVSLQGQGDMADLKLTAYWNPVEQMSRLSIERLPELPDNQCFQLWADVHGEMLNLGVLKDSGQMAELNFLADAESLNVTIEPEGGSDHPTVANLVASQSI